MTRTTTELVWAATQNDAVYTSAWDAVTARLVPLMVIGLAIAVTAGLLIAEYLDARTYPSPGAWIRDPRNMARVAIATAMTAVMLVLASPAFLMDMFDLERYVERIPGGFATAATWYAALYFATLLRGAKLLFPSEESATSTECRHR